VNCEEVKIIRVAIIGAGAMGEWLADFAKKQLGDVLIHDIDERKATRVARKLDVRAAKSLDEVRDADISIVSVPISKTPEVLNEVSAKLKDGALLMDIASTKSEAVAAMKRIKAEIELVSLHPLFGPGAKSVSGKDFIAIPVKPGKRYAEFKKILIKLGARVTEMNEDEHDRLMATVQCLTHFLLISYIASLKSMNLKKLGQVRTPLFDSLLNLAKAILVSNPDLYFEIQSFNKYSHLAREKLFESCRALDAAFEARECERIRKIFEDATKMWSEREVKNAYRRLYKYFEWGELEGGDPRA
jgi:prephenate dehydrogenase